MMLAANAASIISGTLSSPIIASRVMAMKAMYEPIMYTSPWAKLIMPMMP